MNTNPNAKRILCFWDSYTWWCIPWTKRERFPADVRRTWLVQKKLWELYEVIEEWLVGRTLISNHPKKGKEWRCGYEYLLPCLDSHEKVDLVILMLWTNESKKRYGKSAKEIWELFEENYIKAILNRSWQFSSAPRLLIMCPPVVDEKNPVAWEKFEWGNEKLITLQKIYWNIANKYNLPYINTAEFLEVWTDGIHIDAHNHRILAEKIYTTIKEMM